MIRRIRRQIRRNRTEAQARADYAAYASGTEQPISYRQWLDAQKKTQQ